VFRFTVDKDDLLNLGKWVRSIEPASRETDVGVALVRALGEHTTVNFSDRGKWFGKKWQNISKYTEVIREERGIPVLNPPLHGKGWLRLATGEHLSHMPWNNAQWSSHDRTRYRASPSDGDTSVFVNVSGSHAVVKIIGAKAAHMTGDISKTFVGFGQYKKAAYGKRGGTDANRYGYGYLPPRPFWGVHQKLLEDASTKAVNRIFINWYNQSPNKRGTWFKPSITEWVN
jgi:hypothetical protein